MAGLAERLQHRMVGTAVAGRSGSMYEQAKLAAGVKSGKLSGERAARLMQAVQAKWRKDPINVAGFAIPKMVLILGAVGAAAWWFLKGRKGGGKKRRRRR